MKNLTLNCAAALLGISASSASFASLVDVAITGSILEGNPGSTYYGGYSPLDFLPIGDPFTLNLRLDSAAIIEDPLSTTRRFIGNGSGPVIIETSIEFGSLPGQSFSLLGGPTTIPGYSACFETGLAECLNDTNPLGPDRYAITEVVSESFAFEQTAVPENIGNLSWQYIAHFDNEYAFHPDDPHRPPFPGYLASSLFLSSPGIGTVPFEDFALLGPTTITPGADAFGVIDVFSNPRVEKAETFFNMKFAIAQIQISPLAPIPEAETWAMMIAAAAVFGWRLRQRNGCQTNRAIAA